MFRTCLFHRLRNSSYCLLLALGLMQSVQAQQPAAAEDRWYDVEVLIFKYSNPDEFGSENWPERWTLPDTKNSVDPDAIDIKYGVDFQALDPKTQSFGGMLEKLDKSVRYEVLNHSAWRQRGLDKQHAVGVRIRAGRRYLSQAPVTPTTEFGLFEESFIEQGFLPEVTLRRYTETQSKSGSTIHELDGEIKIVLSRYLHVYADLLLLKPVTLTPVETARQPGTGNSGLGSGHDPLTGYSIAWGPEETGTSGATLIGNSTDTGTGTGEKTLYGFNIKAHRRMRSGELHHLDHPLIGILIQIKPVETAKP